MVMGRCLEGNFMPSGTYKIATTPFSVTRPLYTYENRAWGMLL